MATSDVMTVPTDVITVSTDVITVPTDVTTMPFDVTDKSLVLRDVLAHHRPELLRCLDANTLFLTYLARHKIIEPADILKYEHYKERERRNKELLDKISDREAMVDDCYSKFIDALKRSDQEHLAAMLTNIDKELQIVGKYQTILEDNLDDIHTYLQKESRRTELHYSTTSPQPEPPHGSVSRTHSGVADLLYKVHESTKSTIVHFDRCREVIDKLHSDCDVVAKKNGDMLNKLRECDTLVKHVAPPYAKREFELKQQDKQEVGSIASGASISTRSRMNEAETLMDSVRHSVGALVDERHERETEERESLQIVEAITSDIKTRRNVLGRCTEPPPRDLYKNKYTKDQPGGNVQSTKPKTMMKAKILDLAEELPLYVQQESQVTHMQTVGKLQNTSGLNHRNFDQIEHDIMHLDKEVRRGDHQRAGVLIKQVSEATKVEREDCMRIVDDIGRVVRMRRLKLEEISTGNRPKRKAMAKRKTTRTLSTNFAKKLSETEREIRTYMDQEIDLMAKHKEDAMKAKLAYDKELRFKIAEAKNLERRVREIDLEREKYKKLYDHEKAMKEARMLTKPIIPKRVLPEIGEAEADVQVEVSYQRPSPRRTSTQLSYTRKPRDSPSKSPTRTRQRARQTSKYTKNSRSLAQPRDSSRSRQGAASGSFPARAAAKPRLTPRAKHLTKLKATAKEKQMSTIVALPRQQHNTVRNV